MLFDEVLTHGGILVKMYPMPDGAWCRAFDMDLKEAYGCPHDVGWAANCCETGWTVAEILMGMMLMDILPPSYN